MDKKMIFSAVFLLGVLISSFSQILLKKSAGQNGSSGIQREQRAFGIPNGNKNFPDDRRGSRGRKRTLQNLVIGG